MTDLSPTSRLGERSDARVNLRTSFPAAAVYRAMRPCTPGVVRDEPPLDDEPFSERHLQCIWADAALRPKRLQSLGGEEISVVHPGRWNLEQGPDFLDAVLRVGPDKRRRQGDVEIHIRPSDWHHHGHDSDPHYRRVAAHVCYFDDRAPVTALPPGTLRIALKDAIRTLPGFSFASIDLTAYPYAAPQADPAPCSRVLHEMSVTRWEALLDAAGSERLRRKTARMQTTLREVGPDQCLFEEVMGSLGYKHNQGPFRRLARQLPLATLHEEAGHDPEAFYAILLGVAGLLPRETKTRDPQTRSFVRRLWGHWWKQQSARRNQVLPPDIWHTGGQRPHNHPIRRLAAAAALFAPEETLSARLTATSPSLPAAWFRHATATLATHAGMEYWTERLTFSGKRSPRAIALLGPRRGAAILSNVIVPFLAATGVNVAPLLNRLCPEQDNAILRQTAYSLFGRDHNPSLYRSGLRQQGLLQIFHDFCINTRRGCPDCPLAAALRNDASLGSAP